VLIEALEDGLLTLTLNRPERRNALDTAMLESLVDATRRAATNPAVSAVMLTGAGGTFCVGGDVKAMAARGNETMLTDDRIADLRDKMEADAPAARDAQADDRCDRGRRGGRRAVARARLRSAHRQPFGQAHHRLCQGRAFGRFRRHLFLTKLLGSAKARELYLTSPILSADEALRIGLVTRIVDDSGFQEAAKAYAMTIARGPRLTLGYIRLY
jgi:2-(1,2-epoxy-1,2-dihydrophenyl)acetyl-CoA isomerase